MQISTSVGVVQFIQGLPMLSASFEPRRPPSCAYRRSRPPIPTDRDHLFRSIATSVARVLTAPLDDGGDVSLLKVGQARREAVPVVNRREVPVDPPGRAGSWARRSFLVPFCWRGR